MFTLLKQSIAQKNHNYILDVVGRHIGSGQYIIQNHRPGKAQNLPSKNWILLLLRLHSTVPQNFKLRPKPYICFDLVKACEGVFLLCFLGQIVT